MVNRLEVQLGNWTLDNPIIPASGSFGFGYEYGEYYDLNKLGSMVLKGTTSKARFGNPTPRIAETPSGLLNSVGLQNPGVKAVIEEELPKLQALYHKKAIANVCGFSVEEYVEVARAFDQVDLIQILEINISCPNVKDGGMGFGMTCESAAEVTRAVKKAVTKPIYIKLSPNASNIADIAKACEDEGADGISLINTLLGMRINLKTGKAILANTTGGLSGPAVFPIALRMVAEVYEAVSIPVLGIGGISSARDVIEMMMAGASAVQIGAANLVNPYICSEIIDDLLEIMDELGIENLSDIIGVVHRDYK